MTLQESVEYVLAEEAAHIRTLVSWYRKPNAESEGHEALSRNPAENSHGLAFVAALGALISHGGSSGVRRWVVQHRDGDDPYPHGRTLPPMDLYELAHRMADWAPINRWQKLPASKRRDYGKRIAKLARDLAAALDEDARPSLPNALDLFDPAIQAAALGADPTYQPVRLVIHREGEHYSEARTLVSPGWSRVLAQQRFGPMLSRLAEHVGSLEPAALADKRPNTGNANQRAAARHVAAWFEKKYGMVPNGQVADLVNIMVPSRDSPATDVSVREWRGAK